MGEGDRVKKDSGKTDGDGLTITRGEAGEAMTNIKRGDIIQPMGKEL